jgi:hypothetical protein
MSLAIDVLKYLHRIIALTYLEKQNRKLIAIHSPAFYLRN